MLEILSSGLEPECICCPCLKLCTAPPATISRVPRAIMSNCGGSGFDMFETVHSGGV